MHRLNEQRMPVPLPVPLYRGVHCYDEMPSGCTVYYAMTSAGQLLNGELRRRHALETEAMVVREMWSDLEKQDPATDRPRLVLVGGAGFQPSRMVPRPRRPARPA